MLQEHQQTKWLIRGLGTAVIMASGCLNSHTSRDARHPSFWPSGESPVAEATPSATSPATSPASRSTKVTATVSDENSEPTAVTAPRTFAPIAQFDSASLPPSPQQEPVPSGAVHTAHRTQTEPSAADSVQPAAATSPLDDSNSPSTSDAVSSESATSSSALSENSNVQPSASRLSDFVESNRLAPGTSAGHPPDSGPSPSASTTGDMDATDSDLNESDAGSGLVQEGRTDDVDGEAGEGELSTAEVDLASEEPLGRRVPSAGDLAPAAAGSADTVASPVPASETHAWQLHLEQSIEALENQLAAGTLDAAEQMRLEGVLRLMYLAASRSEEATASLEHLPSEQRRFWKHGLSGLLALLAPDKSPLANERATAALRHFRDACHGLAAFASLEVRNLAFCRRVESFGRYTEFEPYEFLPEQEVILYAEVNNFTVEKTSEGYESELLGSYQIFDDSGRQVGDYELPLDKQVCRHIRTDYFLPYRVYLPKTLEEGSYKIQVTMQDRKGQKIGQTEPVEFRIRDE